MSADASLPEYCRTMQQSQSQKIIILIVLISLLVVIVVAYYLFFYRRQLRYRHCLRQIGAINEVLQTEGTPEEKLQKVRQRSKGHFPGELQTVVHSVCKALEEEAAAAAARDSADYTAAWRGKYEFIPAEVIKNSVNKQHNYLIIGKGSDDGVRPQTGIITSRGVIGIVDAVSRHYSYAISFLNSDSSISARIGKDGAAGPMAWDGKGSGNALLREIPLQVKFEEGDTVYTSGFSTIFPPDIPIGRITGSRIVNGATFEIKVSLFQDFSSVRHVCLVRNRDLDEIMSLEKGGAEQ